MSLSFFAVTKHSIFMLYSHLTCNIHSRLSGWEALMASSTCYNLELFPLTWGNCHFTEYMSCVCSLLHYATWCDCPIHQPGHLGVKNSVDQTRCLHLRCCHHYCLEAGNLHMNGRRDAWISWQWKIQGKRIMKPDKILSKLRLCKIHFLYKYTKMTLYFILSSNHFLDSHTVPSRQLRLWLST